MKPFGVIIDEFFLQMKKNLQVKINKQKTTIKNMLKPLL